MYPVFLAFFFLVFPCLAGASPAFASSAPVDLTGHWLGYASIALFVLAYLFVIAEELVHLKKSKPVILVAGIIWIMVAAAYRQSGRGDAADLLRHGLLEYAELFLFLLSAMVYINTLSERRVFEALRGWLVSKHLSLRALYWITGFFAFFMSPVADNLTTALVLGAVAMAVGRGSPAFVAASCVNIVVSANAGGAFSPFGDITTLMVWQKGVVGFFDFFDLFLPALSSWLVPAFIMSFAVPKTRPRAEKEEGAGVKPGGFIALALFLLTVAGTVALHHLLHLPPFLGMMTGLGLLMVLGYFLGRKEMKGWRQAPLPPGGKPARKPFDIFVSVKRVEWDTLLFFYGIMLCVGGLGAFGYLAALSGYFYGALGPTTANVLIGLASSVVDNIPVMFAVLSMNPEMNQAQWLLVTLTAGIGGSLLSIGSAAGVALMGQARGVYTFFSHLKWAWAIALGYAAGIALHLFLNGA